MNVEQFQTENGSDQMYTDNDEMMLRQKYLRQPNETKEQRERRNANVRKMLAESREATTGVRNQSVLSSFSKGRGVE